MSYDFAAAPPYTVVTAKLDGFYPVTLLKHPGDRSWWRMLPFVFSEFTDEEVAADERLSDVVEVARPVDEGWVTVNMGRLQWAHAAAVDDGVEEGSSGGIPASSSSPCMSDWRTFLSAVTEGPDA